MEVGAIIAIFELSANITLLCVRYVRELSQYAEETSQILQQIGALQSIVGQLRDTSGNLLPQLQPALEQCQKDLENLEKELTPSDRRWQKTKQKLIWPLKREALAKTLRMIERHKSTFSLALTANVLNTTQQIRHTLDSMTQQDTEHYSQLMARVMGVHETVREAHINQKQRMHKTAEAEEEKSLRSWLQIVDYESNRLKTPKRSPGTGEWFERDISYQDWVKPVSVDKRHLWLSGQAGAGKTVILSSILDKFLPAKGSIDSEVVESPTTVLYFYFDYTESRKRKTSSMITALLDQCDSLKSGLSPLLTELRQLYRDATSVPIEKLSAVLVRFLTEFQGIVIFLDAVDECEDLAMFFSTLGTIIRADALRGRLRTMTTSRDEFDIARNMAVMHIEKVSPAGRLIDDDIAKYIRERLEVDFEGHFKMFPDSLKAEIFVELSKNCRGMFRMAQCQLDQIADRKSQKEVHEALGSLPRTLYSTYQWILDEMKPSDKKWARRVLLWLSGSPRPITLGMLKEAIIIDLDTFEINEEDRPFDPDSIVRICRSLITTQPKISMAPAWPRSPTISLAHSSVKQYLDTPGALDFYLPSSWVQQTLAKACLAYSTSPVFVKLQANWDREDVNTDQDYDLWEFLDYCTAGIFEHLQMPGAEKCCLPFVMHRFRNPTSLSNYYKNAEFVSQRRLLHPAKERYPSWPISGSENSDAHEFLEIDYKSSVMSKAAVYELWELAWALLVSHIDLESLDTSFWSPVSHFAAANAVEFLKEVLRGKNWHVERQSPKPVAVTDESLRNVLQPLGFGIIPAIARNNAASIEFLINELRQCPSEAVPGKGKGSLQARLLSLTILLSAAVGNESVLQQLIHMMEEDKSLKPAGKREVLQQALYCAAKHGQEACVSIILQFEPHPAMRIPLWQAESILYAYSSALVKSANVRWAELCQEHLSLEIILDDQLYITPPNQRYEENALIASVSAGNHDIVRILVGHGMDPFLEGFTHESAFSMVLSRACSSYSDEQTSEQDFKLLTWLLDEGKTGKLRQNQLDDALRSCGNNLNVGALLLDAGANPDAALISAVRSRWTDAIQMLLERGGDPNVESESLETPLIALFKNTNKPNTVEVLEHLLRRGADPRKTIKKPLQSPKFDTYWGAVQVGSPLLALARPWWGNSDEAEVHRIQEILDKMNDACVLDDINVFVHTDDHGTPLIAAAARGARHTVDFLLHHGARCDVEGHSNVDWCFPALAAAFAEYPSLAKMLLERECYQSLSDKPQSWARCLILACSQKYHESEWDDLIAALLSHGVDVNYHMDYTYRESKSDPADKLRKYGCALVAACAVGNVERVQTLLQRGAEEYPAHVGQYGSCLAAACQSGEESLVKFLLHRGHDVSQLTRGVMYWCPLLAAASSNYDENIVQLLLDNGANPAVTYPAPNPMVSNSDVQSLVIHGGRSWHSAIFWRRMWDDSCVSGPSLDQADFFYGSPSVAAATHHGEKILELLASKGVEVNKEVAGAYTTPYFATPRILKRRWKMQHWLIEHGGSPPSPTQILKHPWSFELMQDEFLQSSPDLVVQGTYWGSMLSIMSVIFQSTIPYFLKCGSDPSEVVTGSFYGSAMLTAAALVQPAAVRTFLENGARVNEIAEGSAFGTPLIAACAGRIQLYSWFRKSEGEREMDCSVDDDEDDNTWACDQVDVIEELLSRGADPNLTYRCFSPLLVLVCSGSKKLTQCVSLLLEAGADPHLPLPRYSCENNGPGQQAESMWTALSIAAERGDKRITRILGS